MQEYRVIANDIDSEDKLIRAVHADDLCAAIYELREELHNAYSHYTTDTERQTAWRWLIRLNELLEENNAQAAMDHYR